MCQSLMAGGPAQNYWQCLPLGKNNHNRHIKSIVNTQLVDPSNLVECARLLLPCCYLYQIQL